jgi:hypothetical protein
MKAIAWFILTSALLTACTAATTPPSSSTPISTSTATFVVKTSTPTQVEPTPTGATVEPSPTPTDEPTPTIIPISKWFDYSGDAGKDYSPEQIELITSGALSEQEEQLNNWEVWWGQASNSPFRTETTQVQKVPFFAEDDPNNPEKTIVLWQALGPDNKETMFYLPIDTDNGRFMDSPPGTPTDTIPEDLRPLEVSGGDEGLDLVNIDGELVRKDPRTNLVIEKIDFEKAEWEDIIIADWDVGLIDGAALPRPQRVRVSLENSLWEEGDVILFYMSPTYAHKVIRIKNLDLAIEEITFGFIINGNRYRFKTLYTEAPMIRPDGTVSHFGQNTINLGELKSPQIVGLESAMRENPEWVNRIFSDSDEKAAREVYGGLNPDSGIKEEIRKYWSEGIIPDDWQVDSDGVVDLTELVVLAW